MMGPERVRGLLRNGYFDEPTLPFVRGWLTREEEPNGNGTGEDSQTSDDVIRALEDGVKKARIAADQAKARAVEAIDCAEKARRNSTIAITVGAAAFIGSSLVLVVLAIR